MWTKLMITGEPYHQPLLSRRKSIRSTKAQCSHYPDIRVMPGLGSTARWDT